MDGSHLADFLLRKRICSLWYGKAVILLKIERILDILETNKNFHFITGDLTDQNSLFRTLKESDPDEVI